LISPDNSPIEKRETQFTIDLIHEVYFTQIGNLFDGLIVKENNDVRAIPPHLFNKGGAFYLSSRPTIPKLEGL